MMQSCQPGVSACSAPLSIFHPAGIAARKLSWLGATYTSIACAVLVTICVLLLIALFRRRATLEPNAIVEEGEQAGVRWIVIGGIGIPLLILIVSFVYSVMVQTAIAAPAKSPVATIDVVGHRWWWEVRYVPPSGGDTVVTANEIHIPAGYPVQIHLTSADVIHSFWVPQLAGKTDVVPGQQNVMWLQADHPGVYWGECAEYCGFQHAHMALVVQADPLPQYQRWLAHQRAPANPPAEREAARGLAVFRSASCIACHTVRGADTVGRFGPDLTHVASRQIIAAGVLANTRANLAGWIVDAQRLKPGCSMPEMLIPAQDVEPLVTYLETLQ